MSPIHITVWLCALSFQLINATCIGGWLGGLGPTSAADWAGKGPRVEVGMMIFVIGLLANLFHDDELREIRRAAVRDQKEEEGARGNNIKACRMQKVYKIPVNGLFRAVLYPHYLCEWVEWCGFWMMGGAAFLPGRTFVINEISTMLPRALQGRQWYINRFGKDKVGSRKAIIPGVI